jgi:hypothetical protein
MPELHIDKKAQKIEETDPAAWEDWPKSSANGTRHVVRPSGTTTELIVTDVSGNLERFHLTVSSTYKREEKSDWVAVRGNEGSYEAK